MPTILEIHQILCFSLCCVETFLVIHMKYSVYWYCYYTFIQGIKSFHRFCIKVMCLCFMYLFQTLKQQLIRCIQYNAKTETTLSIRSAVIFKLSSGSSIIILSSDGNSSSWMYEPETIYFKVRSKCIYFKSFFTQFAISYFLHVKKLTINCANL